jgi:hypothetical protein
MTVTIRSSNVGELASHPEFAQQSGTGYRAGRNGVIRHVDFHDELAAGGANPSNYLQIAARILKQRLPTNSISRGVPNDGDRNENFVRSFGAAHARRGSRVCAELRFAARWILPAHSG